jgi:sigma-B regulation protein RsbU (phosphoserine phosphatase)
LILSDKKKYQLLLAISQKVRDTLDLDETMNHILDMVKSVVDYDAAGIFVLNQDLVHSRNEQPDAVIAGIARRGYEPRPVEEDAMLRYGKGIVGHVIFTCSSLVVPDVQKDPRYIEGHSQTLSEIAVPIMRKDRAIGALNLESNHLAAYDENDLEVLQFFADAAAISIEKAMLHQQLLEKELLEKQLQLAREAQSRLFPGEPPHIKGYDIAGICLPAEEIGGDYYDFIKLSNKDLGVAVADVSGHGITSALMMTAFRGLLRMHARGRLGPVKIANAINHLLPDFSSNDDFATLIYIVLNHEINEITNICCGQQPPMVLHSDGSMENLNALGPALGVMKKVKYITEKHSLLPGDILTIHTDGVVELINDAGEEFGMKRLGAAIYQNRDFPAAGIIQKIIDLTRQFSGSQTYQDDFTLVVIKKE